MSPTLLFIAAVVFSAILAVLTGEACQIGPWTLAASGRMWLAFILSIVVLRANARQLLRRPEFWGWASIIAMVFGAPLAYHAFSTLRPGEAMTLMSLGPVWAILIQSLLQRTAPRAMVFAALISCAVGIVILKQPRFDIASLAVCTALLNSVCRGVAISASGRLTQTSPTVVVGHSALGGAISSTLFIVLIPAYSLPSLNTPTLFWGLVAASALVALIANVTATRALKLGSTERLAPLFYLIPVFTLGIELALDPRVPSVRELVSMALILIPAAFVSLKRVEQREQLIMHVGCLEGLGRDEIEKAASAFIAQVEAKALIEVRVHADAGDKDPSTRSRKLFDELGLGATSVKQGLLVGIFVQTGTLTLTMDDFVSQRLRAKAARKQLLQADNLSGVLDILGKRITHGLANTKQRGNEIDDEVSFHGF